MLIRKSYKASSELPYDVSGKGGRGFKGEMGFIHTTRSPTLNLVTLGPTSTTVPAASLPMVRGTAAKAVKSGP